MGSILNFVLTEDEKRVYGFGGNLEYQVEETMNRSEIIEMFARERYAIEGYILAIVRNHHLAEDVFQDVAVEVMEHLDRYDASRDFRSWVRGIARNKAKQALGKESRMVLTENKELERLVEQAYEEQDDATWDFLTRYHVFLSECMNQLKEGLRAMIRMYYQDRRSLAEISACVGKSPGAVQVSLSRARQSLRHCIEKRHQAMSRGEKS